VQRAAGETPPPRYRRCALTGIAQNRQNVRVRFPATLQLPLFSVVSLVFFGGTAAFGQQPAPQFRAGSPELAQLPGSLSLPSSQPQTTLDFQQAPTPLPIVPPPIPGQFAPLPQQTSTQIQLPLNLQQATSGSTAPAGGAAAVGKAETPVALQRHPLRNIEPFREYRPFTLRMPGETGVAAQISAGFQTDVRYNDNINSAPAGMAVGDAIVDWTPIIQLNIGDPAGERPEGSLDSTYYLEVQYLPTIHERLNAGTTRTLQRLIGEAGRANAILRTAVRFEYDENLFGASGESSQEDTFTILEVSPIIEYNLSAKTTLYAEGTFRRVTLQPGTGNRTAYILDTGFDCATSVKTTIGLGSEVGHIQFDQQASGAQDYQQGYVSWAWRPTAKIGFQTRVGAELRHFKTEISKPDRISPIVTATLNWQASDSTRVNAGFRVRNQPSVVLAGGLFQEIRLGADVTHDLAYNLYIRGEAEVIRRNYDNGLSQIEWTLRPALGYRTKQSKVLDSLTVELYYEFRGHHANLGNSDFQRNMFGVQTTAYF
jgi:hypothetical protein